MLGDKRTECGHIRLDQGKIEIKIFYVKCSSLGFLDRGGVYPKQLSFIWDQFYHIESNKPGVCRLLEGPDFVGDFSSLFDIICAVHHSKYPTLFQLETQ